MGDEYSIDINNTDYSIDLNKNEYIVEIEPKPSYEIQLDEQGPPGPPGNGISHIDIVSSEGDSSTYRIYFTNGDTYDYTVYNGTGSLRWFLIKEEDWVQDGDKYRYVYSGAYAIVDLFKGNGSNRVKVDVDIDIVSGINYIYSLEPFDGFILCSSTSELIPAQEYIHEQAEPSSVWIIEHNLNTHPSITVVDSSGDVVDGDWNYRDNNTVVLSFTAPFSGVAYLNYTR